MVQGQRQEAGAPRIDDAALVERLRGQERCDGPAFELLYARYARYLAGVVHRLLGVDSEVDDILQESFVDAVEAIHQLNDGAHLRGWLVAIAVRRVNRVLAARYRRRRLAAALALVGLKAHAPAE